MTTAPRPLLPMLVRLAVYYGLLTAAALLLVRWLPATSSAASLTRLSELSGTAAQTAIPGGPLGRPGAALATAIAMVGALALIIPVAWLYIRTKPRARYDASLVHTVIVLPVVVAGIVLIVQNSIALAFSLAGIVAAVRFRNTLRDTKDTIYIFGHANTGLPVTGNRDALRGFQSYLGALLAFVEAQVKAGKSRDEVLAMRDPLAGFESYGRFGQPGPRDALTCAYEEVTAA